MIKEYLERQFRNYHAITSGYVTPEMFGAKGDGVTDDYTAISKATAYAIANRKPLFLSKRYYLGSQWKIPRQLIVEGSSVAPTGQSGLQPLTWNIKSDYPVDVESHTTIRNVGFNKTTLKLRGSRNQVESCVFIGTDLSANGQPTDPNYSAIELSNNTSTTWTGEQYIRDCYFYDCQYGIYNNPASGYPITIDSEISGCTVINDKKTRAENPLITDVFMRGDFSAMRVFDNHIYSTMCANGTLKDLTISNNYFDSMYTVFDCEINGIVTIRDNGFYPAGVDINWDRKSLYPLTRWTRTTSGNKKWLIFENNNISDVFFTKYFEMTAEGSENPKTLGWYELNGTAYVATTDETVVTNKTYYEKVTQDIYKTYWVFLHTTNPLRVTYLNNRCVFDHPVTSDFAHGVRYMDIDVGKYYITYNGSKVPMVRRRDQLFIEGNLKMPPTYGSSAEVEGTHDLVECAPTIVDNTSYAGFNSRTYAVLEYSYDSSNINLKKNAIIRVRLTDKNKVEIQRAPEDYVSNGTLFFNTVIGDYALEGGYILVAGGK